MATYLARPSQTTIAIGHSFVSGSPNDTYTGSRGYHRYDLSGYVEGSDQIFYGDISDGTIIKSEVVPHGTPPDPELP